MAISKNVLNNKRNNINAPEPLGSIPANNPEHRSAPIDMHHPIPPKPEVYDSMQEAVNVCERIFLKPGEAHTEFYKSEDNGKIVYHCVVAIGNANPNKEHLYLTDSGKDKSIDEKLADMANDITLIVKSFTNLDDKFDDLSTNVSEFESRINNAIITINSDINEFEANINASINHVFNIIEIQNSSINSLNSSVASINNIVNILDSSIKYITDIIEAYEPISNPSIDSLFHDDIYTVNLCCYTAGGYVEIYDDVSGGIDPRVADCTPQNEYKTYVNGDIVSFKAVPNADNGYRFVRWYVDHIKDTSNNVITTAFDNKDITVIGTLANDVEPPILEYGYTAVFMKLNQLKLHTYTNTNCEMPVLTFGDIVNITITEEDGTIRHYTSNDTSIYYPNNSKITLEAIPNPIGHTFEEYVIDVSTHITENIITFNNVDTDLNVNVFFKEWWIMVTADASLPYMGQINSVEGIGNYKVFNSFVDIEAVPNEGYAFVRWYDEHLSDNKLEEDIIDGNLSSPAIILKVNKDVVAYELYAEFVKIND